MIVGGLLLLIAVLFAATLRAEQSEMLVRYIVRLALAWYTAAMLLMMRLRANDWSASSRLGRTARWCWTWGIVCFVVHLTMAFNFYHFWSHTHAFQVTRDVSGVGEGIYALYLFNSLWLVDATWWWIWPRRYAQRSPRIDLVLHAFMLFIVFNGMVVFESGFIRWAGVTMFVGLAWAWLVQRVLPARQSEIVSPLR